MSSSKTIKSSSRLKKARILAIFNPLFLGTIGIFSLIAFSVWQYWYNPELGSVSEQKPEPEEVNQENNVANIVTTKKNNVEKLPSNTTKINPNPNANANPENNNVPQPPAPEQNLNSILSENNPTKKIFESVNTRNNTRNSNNNAKLYEQLRSLPNLFPDLLPTQNANNGVQPFVANNPQTANQFNQYQLRSNNFPTSSGNVNGSTPLSQAVNNVMANRNPAMNNQTAQPQPNNGNTQGNPNMRNNNGVPIMNNTPYPNNGANGISNPNNGVYGSYTNYGNNRGYNNYGNTNAFSPTNTPNGYGGNTNGYGTNTYNVNLQKGPKNNTPTQPGFPRYGF